MASYQARGRDPLFDKNTQAILERRGRELVGIGLLLGAVIMALMLGSYLPEDPSWLSATDAPVNNTFGHMGATIASPLMIIVGSASWGIAAVFAVWGVRFIMHRGAERSLSRVVFAPISIALLAVYASTYASTGVQSHGGLFGDTVLAALIQILPLSPALALKSLAFVAFFAAVGTTLFVFGFTRKELSTAGRFMLYGLIGLYSLILHATGKAARGSVATGQRIAVTNAERRAEKQRILAENQALFAAEQAVAPRVVRADPHQDDMVEQPDATEYVEKTGLFSKMPTLLKRAQEVPLQSELVEPGLAPEPQMDGGFDDRVRSKISNVVNARVRAG
jgi:S-DNA-T family DNA segregation ATPase FtsK/SpoIIIE